jgi:iron complex transport system substrate-binding protein
VARTAKWLGGVLALGLVVGACGSPTEGAGGSDAPPAPAAEGDAFPVTVEHKFGSTTVEAMPARVVTVGFTDQDAVLALGVKPVGVREWYGSKPNATYPWAADELGDATPAIIGDGSAVNYEALIAADPDLIIAIYSGITEDEYHKLSEIAPTIAQQGRYHDWAQPWPETTRQVAAALGQPSKADALIKGVEDRFAAARSAHPEFAGTTAAMGQFGEGAGTFFLLHPEDPKAAILTQLGFTIPKDIADLVSKESNEEFSFERLDYMDQGVAVWLAGFERPELVSELRDNPVYRRLKVAQEGRDLFLTDGVDALSWSTVLSIPDAIDIVVPQLARAAKARQGTSGG